MSSSSRSVFNRLSLVVLALTLSALGCSKNILTDFSNKSTDEALYEDALKLLDAEQYAESVTKFSQLSSGFARQTKVREQWAGALAGRCGFNFVNYLSYIKEPTSDPTFFKYLMTPWVGVSTDPDSCVAAEAKMKEIWASESPTASQQLFMAIISLAKMGSVLRQTADNNEASGAGDGTTDAEFDACSNTDPSDPDQISDDQVTEVVTGLSLFLINIGGFSAQLSGDVDGFKTALETACGLMGADNPCETTEASAVTPEMIASVRRLLAYQPTGIGSCVALPTLCCPGL